MPWEIANPMSLTVLDYLYGGVLLYFQQCYFRVVSFVWKEEGENDLHGEGVVFLKGSSSQCSEGTGAGWTGYLYQMQWPRLYWQKNGTSKIFYWYCEGWSLGSLSFGAGASLFIRCDCEVALDVVELIMLFYGAYGTQRHLYDEMENILFILRGKDRKKHG